MTSDTLRALRLQLGLSQAEFARVYRIELRALRSWEQGERRPDPAAATLLRAIEREPEVMREILA